MKRLIPLTGALILALGVSSAALAQNGNGNGHGNGKDKDKGNNGSQDRGGGHENRGGGDDRGDRGNGRDERRAEIRIPDVEREVRGDVERNPGADRGGVVLRRNADRGLLTGCPPGLAKKDNGCLPPGQARRIDEARDDYARYNYLWRARGNEDYRYRDGYLYRMNPQGGLLGYLPVLGGVLSPGNEWPGQYAFQQAPQYLSQYYGLSDRYQYRYADGVLYGVDPQTQGIGQVAALLTGQQFTVGQRIPTGYDVYNLPYAYRNQYVDSAQSQYRYNDGYVYQVDPTTRLVQAAIQLLT
jgi:hypothetical protein